MARCFSIILWFLAIVQGGFLQFIWNCLYDSPRFMGSLQYANATALFMGMGLILQHGFTKQDISCVRSFRLLTLTVFFLTFSAGGIFCYFLGMAMLDFLLSREKHTISFQGSIYREGIETAIALSLALSWFITKFFIKNSVVLICIILITIILSFYWEKLYRLFKKNKGIIYVFSHRHCKYMFCNISVCKPNKRDRNRTFSADEGCG